MKFLADENVDALIVQWLRDDGHEVEFVAETRRAASDASHVAHAADKGQYIITLDRHFGRHALFEPLTIPGILLIRFRYATSAAQLSHLQRIWGNVVVMLPGIW